MKNVSFGAFFTFLFFVAGGSALEVEANGAVTELLITAEGASDVICVFLTGFFAAFPELKIFPKDKFKVGGFGCVLAGIFTAPSPPVSSPERFRLRPLPDRGGMPAATLPLNRVRPAVSPRKSPRSGR